MNTLGSHRRSSPPRRSHYNQSYHSNYLLGCCHRNSTICFAGQRSYCTDCRCFTNRHTHVQALAHSDTHIHMHIHTLIACNKRLLAFILVCSWEIMYDTWSGDIQDKSQVGCVCVCVSGCVNATTKQLIRFLVRVTRQTLIRSEERRVGKE